MISTCMAYIGPGAGFAFMGSFLAVLAAMGLALFAFVSFPVRHALRMLRGRGRRRGAKARRVVVLGLDGMDPGRVRPMMARGELGNLARLATEGHFGELATTCPSISPVAWSTFATGTNPGKHGIFDFLGRDLRTYLPRLSSCRVGDGGGRGEVELLRGSKPFWTVLGEKGGFSAVLRVPVTFPPERFRGVMLSGMCVPDLRGTQGTFTLFEEGEGEGLLGSSGEETGGIRVGVVRRGRVVEGELTGPTHGDNDVSVRFRVEAKGRRGRVWLRIGRERVRLEIGQYTDWVPVAFRVGRHSVGGIVRFLLLSWEGRFRMYATAVQIDPERPAMPVSHPNWYAMYLAKRQGRFATLGLAEDTWALNEGVLSGDQFLQQVYDIHRERERMFLDTLDRVRAGACVCVFDLTDRVQHMFHRQDAEGRKDGNGEVVVEGAEALEDAYRAADALVGRTIERLGRDDVLLVLSDHGFAGFRRGVNLNAWLRDEGYLAREESVGSAEYLAGVDWGRTRAYTFGMAGIYVNVRGREGKGVVDGGDERRTLKAELKAKLKGLRDPATGDVAIREVYDAEQVYSGPHADEGPDLVIGYADGYRASWEAAVGRTDGEVFTDNPKGWSGDHCVDPALVPGVVFCSRRLAGGAEVGRRIVDVAPTILGWLGIEKPGYMDGEAWGLAE